ncbi:hypothetical protein Hanom_Chr03g00193301 [Helianthus anomalus]
MLRVPTYFDKFHTAPPGLVDFPVSNLDGLFCKSEGVINMHFIRRDDHVFLCWTLL